MPPQNQNNRELERLLTYKSDPDLALYDDLDALVQNTKDIAERLKGVPVRELEALKGDDGYTPQRGVDYYTDDEMRAMHEEIQDNVMGNVQGMIESMREDLRLELSPIKGIDYDDGVDGRDGINGVTPVKGVDYFNDEDIQEIVNASIEFLESLEGDARLDASAIKNLESNIDPTKLDYSGVEIDYSQLRNVPKVKDNGPGGGGGNRTLLWLNDITNAATATAGEVLKKRADGRFEFGSGSGLGDMLAATYDPAGKEEQVLTTGDLLDEDDMSTNSATKVPSQQSVKAYVDANAGGASQLSDLSDVNTSTATNRNVLVADGVDWESRALTEADISDLGTYIEAGDVPSNETDPIVGAVTGIVKADGGGNISAAVEDTDYQGVLAEGAFADGDKTKLDGIEASADVTDTANVTAAGALMDSEVTDLDGIKSLTVPNNTTISAYGATLVDDADAATARTTLGLVIGTDVLAEQTIGIANDNLVEIDDADAADDDYAKFTANGLEGRSYAEVKTDLSLNNVDNTSDATKNAASVTLTNKTIDGDNNTISNLAIGAEVDSTTAGDIDLAENNSIDLDSALSADGKYTGICIDGTAGATLAFGDLVYLAAADSRWELADASAASTSGTVLIGICVLAAASDGSATKILLQGTVRAATFPAFTVSAPLYISETAGDITGTAPTTADAVVRVVGYAISATDLYFNPSSDHITHTG